MLYGAATPKRLKIALPFLEILPEMGDFDYW